MRRETVSLRAKHGFYTHRIAETCNALLDDVVATRSVNWFKVRYDKHVTSASTSKKALHSPLSSVDRLRLAAGISHLDIYS